MKKIFMKCGHIANAFINGKPICIICLGLKKEATQIDYDRPNLQGRKARCNQCGKEVDSNFNLPFFEYRHDSEKDSYYCGCGGWE